jgi:hypothetical protein
MKNIIFCLSIASALFFIHSFRAQDAEPELGVKITQQDYPLAFYYQSDRDNLLFDICLEDIFDDDDSDSESKKLSSGKMCYDNAFFVEQNFSDNNYKKIASAEGVFPYRASLLTFICVLRI